MCQNIQMLANSRQMSLNSVFFLHHSKQTESFSSSARLILTVMKVVGSPRWRIGPLKLTGVLSLPFTISDPWERHMLTFGHGACQTFWGMTYAPSVCCRGSFSHTRSSKLSQTLWRTTLLPQAFWHWSDNYSLFHAARSLFWCILHENWARLNWKVQEDVLKVLLSVCVCYSLYYQSEDPLESEDILAGCHHFRGLFEG